MMIEPYAKCPACTRSFPASSLNHVIDFWGSAWDICTRCWIELEQYIVEDRRKRRERSDAL